MKKKMLAVLLAASMVASMTACGSSNSADTTTTEEGTNESTDGAEAAADVSDLKIGLITDVGGVNDGSFNQSSWEGLERAGEELGVTVNYLESATDADYKPNMETFIDEDYDLIISVGYMLADATREAAEANPDTKFAIIDDATIDLPNVTSLMFKAEQASYLVGYVAGLTTKTNNIGFVVGMTNETMNQFGYGYCAGAIDANPDITVQQMNANSFADSATGKSMANAEITNGADIVFQAAGATGLGVIEACQEAGVYAIGVDSDQSATYTEQPEIQKTFVTSVLKKMGNGIYKVIGDFLNNGTLPYGKYEIFGLAEDSVGIVENDLYDQYVSDAGKAMIEEACNVYADIIAKYPNKEEFYLIEAELYISVEKWQKAIEVFDRYEQQNGITEPVSIEKIKLYTKLDDVKKASNELLKLIRKFPDKSEYLSLLAELYFKKDYKFWIVY